MGSFDSRMEGVIAEWGNNATGPFGIVEFIPNEDRSVVSMSSMAMGQIGDETQIGDLEYGEWGGHHGVVINMLGDHNDIAIQRRFLLIDLPAGIVIFQSWAEKSNWNEQIETVLGIETSIRFQDPIPVLPYSEQAPSTLATSDLHTARGAAKLTTRPLSWPERPVPPVTSRWQTVHYPSDGLQLAGFLSPTPDDGETHPVVVWIEGGFGGPAVPWDDQTPGDDQGCTVFTDAGIPVFAPGFRGEIGNPGQATLFYDETTDLLNAIDWLKRQPWVDPDRVYLGGHSTGGTNVLLAAVAGAPVRASIVLGGRANMQVMVEKGGYGTEPYDLSDEQHIYLRSAIHWVNGLTAPVRYFEGDDNYSLDAMAMTQLAQKHGADMQLYSVPFGNHHSIQRPVKQLLAAAILADTSQTVRLDFTEAQLAQAMTQAPTQPTRAIRVAPIAPPPHTRSLHSHGPPNRNGRK